MEKQKVVNQKLESFMRRNLPSAEYQRIRCYERCVVDKSMKLALLTSKNLIITDSPPRTILYTLPLIEFLSLTLVQDLPDFLQGDERFKSQHLSLKFRQDSVAKSESSLSESTGSYVSASSDGDTATEKLSKKKPLSASFSNLSSTSWHGSLPSPRPSKERRLRLDATASLDESASRLDRLNLSDSGSSVSSQGTTSSTTTDLDLFLLTDSTLFFQLLQAASLNEKIAGTRELKITVNGSTKPRRKKSIERLVILRGQLYAQLSSDIQTNKTLEKRFYLVQELFTAACNDMNIKKFFWKDLDLCTALVEDLGKYRQGTGENNRADEIEYLIQLETCLAEMFRESEHLSQRAYLLTANSFIMLRMLVENISSVPRLTTHLTNCTEVEDLCTEHLDTTTKLLFEVLLAVTEHPTYGTELSVSRVISFLESRFSTFGPVYSSMVERGLYLISRTGAASTTLLLFSVFFVVEVLGRNSNICRQILTTSHLEDIRYYCANPELKIVRWSPLQTLTIERVNRLLKVIS
ncbi:uncharacterized protein C12orf56-like isoform X2 [Bolinopsis microptera]|uniref:uncharacterized protein C12orf56-like isoform X2 n=1 Tax=Bolinopsis microptera TaxID=2820187 RepID=UPI003078E732